MIPESSQTSALSAGYLYRNKRSYLFALLGLITLTAMIGYALRPMQVSMPYNYFCFGIFLVSTIVFFNLRQKKKNYFDFDTLFILFLAVIGFAYAVFIYRDDDPYNIAFSLTFDTNFIPTGTMSFVLGFLAFYWGSLLAERNAAKVAPPVEEKKVPINNTALSIIVILLSVAFLLSGGVQYYRTLYYYNNSAAESGLVLQIMALLHAFSVTAIATEFYNKIIDREQRINPLLLVSITVVILMMLYAGNRTLSSQLALPVIGLYTLFFKDINFIKFLIFILAATWVMWTIQFTRVGDSVESMDDASKLITDLTIPTRSSYSCMEYIEENGHLWGQNLLGGVIGVIPSLERVLVSATGMNSHALGSAEILTEYTLGPDPYVGLGTNIIADLFLSFDIVGVIVFMFLLGYFVSWHQAGAMKRNYYSMLIYACMMSFSFFLVRTTYTHPVKLIVWCLLIGMLNKSLSQRIFDRTPCEG